jgi:hypothetical protein
MTQGGRSARDLGAKMHPLFTELYLSGDPDDSAEAEEEWRAERTRARDRRRVLQKRVKRRTLVHFGRLGRK